MSNDHISSNEVEDAIDAAIDVAIGAIAGSRLVDGSGVTACAAAASIVGDVARTREENSVGVADSDGAKDIADKALIKGAASAPNSTQLTWKRGKKGSGRMTNNLMKFIVFLIIHRYRDCGVPFLRPELDTNAPKSTSLQKKTETLWCEIILQDIKDRRYYSVKKALADFMMNLKKVFKLHEVHSETYKCGLKLKQAFYLHIQQLSDIEVGFISNEKEKAEEKIPQHIKDSSGLLKIVKENFKESVKYFETRLDVENYDDIVQEHMDFKIIEKKLFYELYEDFDDFVDDMRLLCANGFKFAESNPDYYEAAKEIEGCFEFELMYYKMEHLGVTID